MFPKEWEELITYMTKKLTTHSPKSIKKWKESADMSWEKRASIYILPQNEYSLKTTKFKIDSTLLEIFNWGLQDKINQPFTSYIQYVFTKTFSPTEIS